NQIAEIGFDSFFTSTGPGIDMLVSDVSTEEQEMSWTADTYTHTGINVQVCVTGKPINQQGIHKQHCTAGWEVVHNTKSYISSADCMGCIHLNTSFPSKTFMLQGFGKVGLHTMKYLYKHEAHCTCVGETDRAIYSPRGISPKELEDYEQL
ncbi:DHE3 dehydrogenase, partial [Crotophaga sulcirostris]|nr:DHE3 dehydrogenase [Crotophaga sulcirostris]